MTQDAELPGMWSGADLAGGEADAAEDPFRCPVTPLDRHLHPTVRSMLAGGQDDGLEDLSVSAISLTRQIEEAQALLVQLADTRRKVLRQMSARGLSHREISERAGMSKARAGQILAGPGGEAPPRGDHDE